MAHAVPSSKRKVIYAFHVRFVTPTRINLKCGIKVLMDTLKATNYKCLTQEFELV